VAIPVVIVLIGVVVIIALSLNTVEDGKLCVVLNSKNKSMSDRVYDEGLYMISPAYHFSQGLPAKNNSYVGGVETHDETIDLYAFVVFKFYVKEENVMEFFKALPKNFSSNEADVANAVVKNATPVVTEILGKYDCATYRSQEEKYWIDVYAKEMRERFEAANMLFTLDEKAPVKAVFLFGGCGYD